MPWSELVKLGLSTALGIILAAGLIVWIEPSGWGGMVVLLAVSIAIAFILTKIASGLASLFRPSPPPKKPGPAEE